LKFVETQLIVFKSLFMSGCLYLPSLIVEKTNRTKLNLVIPLNVIQLLKRITSFTHLLDVGSRMLDVGCWTGDISQEMEVGRRETEVGCLMLED